MKTLRAVSEPVQEPARLKITNAIERAAALEAIKQYDYAHGYRVEFDTNHVHAVSNRDEGVAAK